MKRSKKQLGIREEGKVGSKRSLRQAQRPEMKALPELVEGSKEGVSDKEREGKLCNLSDKKEE
jgi:hypothetical protein